MSLRITTLATDPEDGRLAGLDGRFDWGEATTLPLAARATAAGADIEVTIARLPDGGGRLVVRSGGTTPSGRVVATSGDGLWRRAPWPANDQLFAMPAADPRRGALVVGGTPATRAELVTKLTGAGVRVREAQHVTASALEACAIVIFPPRPAVLPVDAMAVLAAGRLLVTGPCLPAFGLRAGFSHLEVQFADHAVANVIGAIRYWEAFSTLRTWAGLAVERQRASVVLPRLAHDLLLDARSG
jgi:hypothetical protein